MDMCSGISKAGRNVTGDRLHSSIELAKELFNEKVIYCGTIMPIRKNIPIDVKNVKERELESSLFVWKKNSLVMVVLYCSKKIKRS